MASPCAVQLSPALLQPPGSTAAGDQTTPGRLGETLPLWRPAAALPSCRHLRGFWGLRTIAEACNETLRSLSPLLPELLDTQPWVLRWGPHWTPPSVPPRLCHGSGQHRAGRPWPPLMPRALPAGSPPDQCLACFKARNHTAGGKRVLKGPRAPMPASVPPGLSTTGNLWSALPHL